MTHDVYTRHAEPTRVLNAARPALVAVLLLLLALLTFTNGEPDANAPDGGITPVAEDWHGNVRRSYGPY